MPLSIFTICLVYALCMCFVVGFVTGRKVEKEITKAREEERNDIYYPLPTSDEEKPPAD